MNKITKPPAIALLFLFLLFVIYRSYPPAKAFTARTTEDYSTPGKTGNSTFLPLPTPDPTCIAQGGRWESLGFKGYGCNMPTTDGGNFCTSSNMCEGACLADNLDELYRDGGWGLLLPDTKRINELNARGEVVGTCSSWHTNFGCHIFVQQGQYVEMCLD